MPYQRELLRDYLQWDIDSWAVALAHWDAVLDARASGQEGGLATLKALDLGARDGGLSLYLAHKGMKVVCSDLMGPSELAHDLHRRHDVEELISYASVDATDIAYPDGCFDVLVFKSLLGGVGAVGGREAMRRASSEMYRVLRPGGLLLFAENQRGTLLHQTARRLFVPWGRSWQYPSFDEMAALLSDFAELDLRAYGFSACFKKESPALIAFDRLACKLVRPPSCYLAFGHAQKGS